jgi:bifunctional non-homologous end joining protein LigD
MHVANHREALRRAASDPVTFVAFDVLYADGHLLVDAPYDERRALLDGLALSGPSFITTESFRDVEGKDILDAVVQNGLEGIVAKRRDGPYRPARRHPDWVKVKSFRTQEVVIGGWTEGRGERGGSLGALLLGLPAGDAALRYIGKVGTGFDAALRYIGKVGTGFDAQSRRELLAEMAPLAVSESSFDTKLPAGDLSKAHFVQPRLIGEVEFGEWTTAGRLRHPVWRGLRLDKTAAEVEVEST